MRDFQDNDPTIERVAFEAMQWVKDPTNNRGADQPSLVFARRFAFLYAKAAALPPPAPSGVGETKTRHTMTLTLTEAEMARLEEMALEKDISPPAVFRLALRCLDTADHERKHGPVPRGPLGLAPAPLPSGVVELKEAAEEISVYAVHDNDCEANLQAECDCGYSDTLARLRAAIAAVPMEG